MYEFCFFTDSLGLAQATDFQMRDLMVALISIGLGLNILYAVYSENGRCYELGSVRMLERKFGRSIARIILCCVGGVCLLMGAYLVGQASNDRKIVKTNVWPQSNVNFDLSSISK